MPTPLHVLIRAGSPAESEAWLAALRAAGHAADGLRVSDEAELRRGLEGAPDLVLCGHDPTGCDPRRALEILRAAGASAPLILVAGPVGEAAVAACLREGAADYVAADRLEDLGPAAARALAAWRERRGRQAAEEGLVRTLGELDRERERAAALAAEAERRRRELDAVFDAIADGVVLFDGIGVAIRANPAARTLFGLDPVGSDRGSLAERLGTRHPDGRPVGLDALPSSRALQGETVTGIPLLARHADGREMAILASASPLLADGRVAGAVAVWHDATEPEAAARRLRQETGRAQARARLAARLGAPLGTAQVLHILCEETAGLLEVPAVSVATLDPASDAFRPAAARGLPPELGGQLPPIPRRLFDSLAGPDGRLLQLPDLGRVPEFPAGPLVDQDLGGFTAVSLLHQEVPIGLLCLHGPAGGRGLAADELTLLQELADLAGVAIANARLFEEVRRQRQQLRLLSGWLAEAEEAERRRLARELHDQVGQNLTALGITLTVLRGRLAGQADPSLLGRLEDSIGLVKQTTATIRGLMADLRPPVLDDYGLGEALRWYGEHFAARTGVGVEVRGAEGIGRLAPPLENALFRIAQEALTNAAKHAGTAQVTVSLEGDGRAVRLLVADQGKGFDPATLAGPSREKGWGLIAMRERAEAIGGQCRIESSPAGGTRVLVEVPR